LDISQVRSTGGDYNAGDVGHALEPYINEIAREISVVANDRKTVIFLPLIQTSKKMQEALIAHGISACEVNGESPDRREILSAFERGEFQALCNSMLLTEGWDCPSVDCLVCLRPTKIRSLYAQIVGRGTRIHPGKTNLLLLDFLWLTSRHDLVRPAHLIAPSDEVAHEMTRALETGGAADLQEIQAEAEKEILHEREKALIRQLDEMRKKKRKLVDPLQYAFSTRDNELIDYVPSFPWEKEPSTAEQRERIESAGVFAPCDMPAGHASALLHSLDERRKQNLATPKQIRLLERMGFHEVGLWKFDSASKMIARISANGWRVPSAITPQTYTPRSGGKQ
jgi:superfamily II DNA/RNA helicase